MTIDVTKPLDNIQVSELAGYIRETRVECTSNSVDYSAVSEELVTARGSRTTLDQRLDVALNEDGTLKPGVDIHISEWIEIVATYVYSNSTTFTISGDQTDIFTAKRRVKINMSASTTYSEVVSSTYNAGPVTTTIVVLDAVVGATLVSVNYGIIAPIGDDSSLSMNMFPDASVTVKGLVELATDAETITGTDSGRVVTPASIQAKVASDTAKGIVELATDAETITGTDTGRAVTPANIQAKVATETAKGIVELATVAEVTTGTDTTRAVTAAGVAAAIGSVPIPDATTTVKGKVELATDAETIIGTDTSRAVTPSNIQAKIATSTALGIVELATDAETISGADDTRVVTPAGLQAKVASESGRGIVELATNAEVITGTETDRAVTPAGLQAKVASATAKGIVELATDAETITGTDTTRAITPANLTAGLVGKSVIKRLSATLTVTDSDTPVDIPGLSVDVLAGSTYHFRAHLILNTSCDGGFRVKLSGTCTRTTMNYNCLMIDLSTLTIIACSTNQTALDQNMGTTTADAVADGVATIEGTIIVNAAGTLKLQLAQWAEVHFGQANCLLGSTFHVTRL